MELCLEKELSLLIFRIVHIQRNCSATGVSRGLSFENISLRCPLVISWEFLFEVPCSEEMWYPRVPLWLLGIHCILPRTSQVVLVAEKPLAIAGDPRVVGSVPGSDMTEHNLAKCILPKAG